MEIFERAYRGYRDARSTYFDTVKATFTPGRRVFWKKAKNIQTGVVVCASHDRILVENERTGREMWLYDFWFTSRYGGGLDNPPASVS